MSDIIENVAYNATLTTWADRNGIRGRIEITNQYDECLHDEIVALPKLLSDRGAISSELMERALPAGWEVVHHDDHDCDTCWALVRRV